MTAAVILLLAGCLWSILRSILFLLLTASPWRRLLVLAVLLLAAFSAHKPLPQSKRNVHAPGDKNDK